MHYSCEVEIEFPYKIANYILSAWLIIQMFNLARNKYSNILIYEKSGKSSSTFLSNLIVECNSYTRDIIVEGIKRFPVFYTTGWHSICTSSVLLLPLRCHSIRVVYVHCSLASRYVVQLDRETIQREFNAWILFLFYWHRGHTNVRQACIKKRKDNTAICNTYTDTYIHTRVR